VVTDPPHTNTDTNRNVKLYSLPLTFRKVVQQQITGEVVVLIPSFPQILSEFNSAKIMKIGPLLPKLYKKISYR